MMLSKETGITIIEDAFRPFKCTAEGIDFGRLFKFRVFDSEGNEIYAASNNPSCILESKRLLSDMLKHARRAVEEKGHTLEPWKFDG